MQLFILAHDSQSPSFNYALWMCFRVHTLTKMYKQLACELFFWQYVNLISYGLLHLV